MKHQCTLFLLIILFINSIVFAQWSQDLSLNLPVCTQTGKQNNPLIISDGSGGAIILWEDMRNGDIDLYAQRISKDGEKLWQENGIPIVTTRGDQLYHNLVSNGNGGAYIAWISNSYIYVQQISSDGQLLWNQPLRPSSNTEQQSSLCTAYDLNGGLIIAFISGEPQYWNELIVQRIDSSGGLMLGQTGKTIIAHDNTTNLKIDATSKGGALLIFQNGWVDKYYYVQILDQNGNNTLNGDGVQLAKADDLGSYNYADEYIANDGLDGAIIVYEIWGEVYANRINILGSTMWGIGGIVVGEAKSNSTSQPYKYGPQIISDDNQGAYVAWYQLRSMTGNFKDIFVQHLDGTGQKLFPFDGIPVITNNQSGKIGFWYYSLQSDNQGGFIMSWETNPKAFFSYPLPPQDSSQFVWIQHVTASDSCIWPGGLKISTSISNKHSIQSIPDSNGGVISVWADNRKGNFDIDAQRVDESTATYVDNSVSEETRFNFKLCQNFPNPFNPNTRVYYSIPKACHVSLTIYDLLGRQIVELVNEYKEPGNYQIDFEGKNFASGIYYYRIIANEFCETKKMILLK